MSPAGANRVEDPNGGVEASVLHVAEAWKAAYPGAHAGVLAIRDASNPAGDPALDARKRELEESLRSRYRAQDRSALRTHPVLGAYEAHYKRFDKTYHVLLQLESIVLKNKPIPSAGALVQAMFMAEMDSLLLTAGHDLDMVRPPLTLEVAQGTESYTLLRGTEQSPKAGDMIIQDSEGIISSILYGPDQRTKISSTTKSAIYTVYATAGIGIEAIEHHLREIRDTVSMFAPQMEVELLRVYPPT